MDKILLIPAAKYKDEYEIYIPEIFKIHNTGVLNILYNIIGLPLDDFVKIYIVIDGKGQLDKNILSAYKNSFFFDVS